MIPYVEIKDKYNLKTLYLIEPQECWFELSYQDEGEFEIYCKASKDNLTALQIGRYVSIPNKAFIWVITAIRYKFTANGTRMISATGYEAKWLLNKRCIQEPIELSGTLTKAVYSLVNANLGTTASAARQIENFTVDTNDLLIDISGTQATRGNLLEFVRPLLKNYNCGSQVIYENGKLVYKIFTGKVKNNSVRFSQSLDNLLSSEYLINETDKATNALVVNTVDEKDYTQTIDEGATGIDRAEILINSNLSTDYKDANGVERSTTPTSSLFIGWQIEEGKNALAEHTTIEDVNGEIDLINSNYEFDKDYYLGDFVGIQDEYFNYKSTAKILKYTFRQDANGYKEDADYGR